VLHGNRHDLFYVLFGDTVNIYTSGLTVKQ
jgi:hypothetical protein